MVPILIYRWNSSQGSFSTSFSLVTSAFLTYSSSKRTSEICDAHPNELSSTNGLLARNDSTGLSFDWCRPIVFSLVSMDDVVVVKFGPWTSSDSSQFACLLYILCLCWFLTVVSQDGPVHHSRHTILVLDIGTSWPSPWHYGIDVKIRLESRRQWHGESNQTHFSTSICASSPQDQSVYVTFYFAWSTMAQAFSMLHWLELSANLGSVPPGCRIPCYRSSASVGTTLPDERQAYPWSAWMERSA